MSSDSGPTPKIAACFVLHSPLLSELRKDSLRLIDEKLGGEFPNVIRRITAHEISDVTPHVAQLVDVDANKVHDVQFKGLVRPLQLRQLSNAMKHLAAAREIAQSPTLADRDFGLVMEDDALFSETVADALRTTARDAPADADIVFLGLPSPQQPVPGKATFGVALDMFPVLPACDSYLVTKRAAAKLSASFLPVRFPTNVQLTYLAKTLGLRYYVAVPNVFVDGSKLGVFASSVEPNSRLLWNQPYCRMETALKAPGEYTAERRAEFEAALAEQPFREHPDVLALVAMHEAKKGDYAAAEGSFAKAVEVMDKSHCIVNNSSDILRHYMAVYRDLQHLPLERGQ